MAALDSKSFEDGHHFPTPQLSQMEGNIQQILWPPKYMQNIFTLFLGNIVVFILMHRFVLPSPSSKIHTLRDATDISELEIFAQQLGLIHIAEQHVRTARMGLKEFAKRRPSMGRAYLGKWTN